MAASNIPYNWFGAISRRRTGPGTQGTYEYWLSQAKKAAEKGIDMALPQQFNYKVNNGWGGTQSGTFKYSDIVGGPGGKGGSELATLAKLGQSEAAAYEAAQYDATAKGLKPMVGAYDDVLSQIDEYTKNMQGVWAEAQAAIDKANDNARNAINAGYNREQVKKAYADARTRIEAGIEEVTNTYQQSMAVLDELSQSPIYSADKRVNLIKTSLEGVLGEHLKNTADFLQRTGSGGSAMPMTRELMKAAMGSMVPAVAGQVEAAGEAQERLADKRTDLDRWKAGETVGLQRNLATLYQGEGQDLTSLDKWRAENLAGIEQGAGSQALSLAGQKAGTYNTAMAAKTSATLGKGQTQSGIATAKGMSEAAALKPTDYGALTSYLSNLYSTGGGKTRTFANTSGTLSPSGTKGVGGQNYLAKLANSAKATNPLDKRIQHNLIG